MSATLDDQEPYEVFQDELDAYLKQYEQILTPHIEKKDLKSRLHTLHHFIEFISFVKMKSSFDEITPEDLHTGFPNYLKENFFSEISFPDIHMILNTYFHFIKSLQKNVPQSLLDSLKN